MFFLFSLALAFEPPVWISPNRNLPEVVQVHQIRFQRTQDKDSLNPVSFSYGSFFLCASLSELAARGHEDKQTTESKNLEGNFLTSHVLWCFVVFILQAVPVVFFEGNRSEYWLLNAKTKLFRNFICFFLPELTYALSKIAVLWVSASVFVWTKLHTVESIEIPPYAVGLYEKLRPGSDTHTTVPSRAKGKDCVGPSGTYRRGLSRFL